MTLKGRVLVVAGSDSGGGAGIQADIKTITALGGYAMTAVTALTAQNTKGVTAVHAAPPGFVAEQIRVTLSDLGADAVKTGMLADAAIIGAVADVLDDQAAGIPWVIDPVMVAKGGDRLLAEDAVTALKQRLVARAAVVTPNVPEAAVLTGDQVTTVAEMEAAGRALVRMGAKAALVKGGHLPGDTVTDVLVTGQGTRCFKSKRIDSRHTHGTGCTLASAVACSLAQGLGFEAAVRRARDYVAEAIRTAPGFGAGHGPLNHAHTVRPAKTLKGKSEMSGAGAKRAEIDVSSRRGLQKSGFGGFSTIRTLRANGCSDVPRLPGVYLVLTQAQAKPRFLRTGTGGRFKSRNPNVPVAILRENWVPGAIVLYVGLAGGHGSRATLRSRMKQFLKFGEGKPVGHHGGRYVWQIKGVSGLRVCWMPTPDRDPGQDEKALMESFVGTYGRLPFANLRR